MEEGEEEEAEQTETDCHSSAHPNQRQTGQKLLGRPPWLSGRLVVLF